MTDSSEAEMANNRDEALRALFSCLRALQPYLDEMVLIGGWVPALHLRFGGYAGWTGSTSLTQEADILLPRALATGLRSPVSKLLKDAGFFPNPGSGELAAVWEREPEYGQKIEFLVPHEGTAETVRTVVPIEDQVNLGGISLAALKVMQQHTVKLTIFNGVTADGEDSLVVRVPLLGAYVINKAVTYPQRTARAGGTAEDVSQLGKNPKQAKDIVYLFDCADSAPLQIIERDLKTMHAQDQSAPPEQLTLARHNAITNLSNVIAGKSKISEDLRTEAARMLMTRDAKTYVGEDGEARAKSTLLGRLMDLRDILQS